MQNRLPFDSTDLADWVCEQFGDSDDINTALYYADPTGRWGARFGKRHRDHVVILFLNKRRANNDWKKRDAVLSKYHQRDVFKYDDERCNSVFNNEEAVIWNERNGQTIKFHHICRENPKDMEVLWLHLNNEIHRGSLDVRWSDYFFGINPMSFTNVPRDEILSKYLEEDTVKNENEWFKWVVDKQQKNGGGDWEPKDQVCSKYKGIIGSYIIMQY